MAADVGAVVPAAGLGTRFGAAERKAFIALRGEPLVVHGLRALEASASVACIVVATRDEDRGRMERLIRRAGLTKVRAVVRGGATRAQSVTLGVAALPSGVPWVLVHDGARPCVTSSLVEACVAEGRRGGAVACGLPAWLTVKAVDERRQVRLTLDRDSLWFAQTPQVFRRDWFETAARRLEESTDSSRGPERVARFPDDVAMLEWAGFPVRMVPGDPLNIKVTTREDALLAEAILGARELSAAAAWRRQRPRADSRTRRPRQPAAPRGRRSRAAR